MASSEHRKLMMGPCLFFFGFQQRITDYRHTWPSPTQTPKNSRWEKIGFGSENSHQQAEVHTHKLVGPAAAEVEIKTPVTSDSIVLYLSSNGIQGCVTIHPVGGLPIFTEGDTWENQIQVWKRWCVCGPEKALVFSASSLTSQVKDKTSCISK